jgi:ureidoglycolate lyase
LDTAHGPRAVTVQDLSLLSFDAFGSYASMLKPELPQTGALRVEFYRDAKRLGLSPAGAASVHLCLTEPRPPIVDILACCNSHVTGFLPLDGDVLLQLAPASPSGAVPLSDIAVFRIPRGTLCTIREGVWHYAPYPAGDQPVLAFIVQPGPAPPDDYTVLDLEPSQQVRICP